MKRLTLTFTTKQLGTIEEALQMLALDYAENIIGKKRSPVQRDIDARIKSVRTTISRTQTKRENKVYG